MKRLNIVSACVLSFLFLTSAVVYGENLVKSIKVTYRNISILVNGKMISSEQEPFIYQGRTFVPLRTIGEAVNKKVVWDNAKNQVVFSDSKPPFVRLDSIQSLMSYLPDQYKMTKTDEKLTEEDFNKLQEFNDNLYKRIRLGDKAPSVKDESYQSYQIDRLNEKIKLFFFFWKNVDKNTNVVTYHANFPCIKYADGSMYFLSGTFSNNTHYCGASDGWYSDKHCNTDVGKPEGYYLEYIAKVNNSILFDKPNRSQQITDLYVIYYWFRNSNLFTEE